MNEPDVIEGELLPRCGAPGCRIVARPGQPMCDAHAVQQCVLSARRKLAEAAPMAADKMIALCESDNDEVARRASADVLDRAGVRGGVELHLSAGEPGRSPAEVLRERIDLIRKRVVIEADAVQSTHGDEVAADTVFDPSEPAPGPAA